MLAGEIITDAARDAASSLLAGRKAIEPAPPPETGRPFSLTILAPARAKYGTND